MHRRSVAGAIATCAVAAAALGGCGSGGPSMAQLRETVYRYLNATSPAERCQLLTTVYRTENPNVVLLGGCEQSEQATAREQAARQRLRIIKVNVRGDQATVTLAPATSSASTAADLGVAGFTGLELETGAGRWLINGFTETASATAEAG